MKNNDIITTIKELYAVELIFADFRLNEVKVLEEDRLFYIPLKNKRIDLRNNIRSGLEQVKNIIQAEIRLLN